MAQVNLVKKTVKLGIRDIIKFQLLTYCFVRDIQFSNSELDCLTLLGAYGEHELSDFCNVTVEEKIFKTSQTVRNFLTKVEKMGIIKKVGTNKKRISLSKELEIQTDGNIMLDYKIVYVAETQ